MLSELTTESIYFVQPYLYGLYVKSEQKTLHGVCACGSHVDIALNKNYCARCTLVCTYNTMISKVKVKVKFTLEQSTKAQRRRSRGIALLLL